MVEGKPESNPLFKVWKRQDKMLYSALIGTLSLTVQPLVARTTTSHKIWKTLANTYGKPSRRHVKQIKQQLKHITKGTTSVTDYMRNNITKSDQLALLGSPLEHEDLLDVIIDGLGDDFRSIVEMVNGRDVPISLEELQEKLLNRENTLVASADLVNFSMPAMANAANYSNQQPPRGNYRGSNQSRGNYRSPRP